jgi:DNA topoisomerase-1
VDSADVNDYLHEITGSEFSAKDFRTWAGTVQAALALSELGPCTSETHGKRNIAEAVRRTAARLGNRPATCRSYYIHPAVLDCYLAGNMSRTVYPPPEGRDARTSSGLHPEEEWVVSLIRGMLSAEAPAAV